MNLSRRALLAASATVPFLGKAGLAQSGAKILRFGLSSYPPSLQPFVHTGTAALTVKLLVYRGLTGFGADGEVRPELAESWKQEGPTRWVFKLRPALFQNGKPVTAEDVKWSFAQISAQGSTAHFRTEFANFTNVETPDAQTVVITTKEPIAVLPLWFASPHVPILASGSTEGNPMGVGAGPFSIRAQERGVSIDLVKFDKYFKSGQPKIDGMKIVAYADENLRVAALEAGDVDLIEYVPWQHMAAIEKNPRLKLDSADGPFMALGFNGGTGPFKDVRLRQAVAHAIRREEIVEAAFFGRGRPLEGIPIPSSSPFYDAALAKTWTYNPDRAKKLMAEAGVARGFSCTLLSTAQYGMHKSTAEVVQAHLSEIGIDVKLNLPDWATRVDLGSKGSYEFCVQGTTADNNDPDGLAPIMDGDLPMSNSRSVNLPTPVMHELFIKGRAELDPAKRKAIYNDLVKNALEVAPIVGLAWRSQGYGMGKNIGNFKSFPGGTNFFSGYMLDEITIG